MELYIIPLTITEGHEKKELPGMYAAPSLAVRIPHFVYFVSFVVEFLVSRFCYEHYAKHHTIRRVYQ